MVFGRTYERCFDIIVFITVSNFFRYFNTFNTGPFADILLDISELDEEYMLIFISQFFYLNIFCLVGIENY